MTVSGNKLAELEPIEPMVSPKIEITVSKDYIYEIGEKLVITGNKDGREVNERVIETLWENNGYISDSTYVELGNFTGNADYNLTLSGSHKEDSSTVMQIINGLTLMLIPYTEYQKYKLVYTLENVKTGKTYTTKANETESMVRSILFFPALPFSMNGSVKSMKHLSEHVYQDFVKQGAFSND
jgi:hypothetical protein